jgi:hypothetical protein
MKIFVIIIIALIPFISGCKKDSNTDPDMQIREIAWNYLNDHAKSTVNVDWEKVPVTKSSFNGIKAYAVRFNTSDDALLGPITVYVSISSRVAIGQDMRD